jgi:hypothetical protein
VNIIVFTGDSIMSASYPNSLAASGKRQAASGKRQAASGKRQALLIGFLSINFPLKNTVPSFGRGGLLEAVRAYLCFLPYT